jgi:hypothetical protein
MVRGPALLPKTNHFPHELTHDHTRRKNLFRTDSRCAHSTVKNLNLQATLAVKVAFLLTASGDTEGRGIHAKPEAASIKNFLQVVAAPSQHLNNAQQPSLIKNPSAMTAAIRELLQRLYASAFTPQRSKSATGWSSTASASNWNTSSAASTSWWTDTTWSAWNSADWNRTSSSSAPHRTVTLESRILPSTSPTAARPPQTFR